MEITVKRTEEEIPNGKPRIVIRKTGVMEHSVTIEFLSDKALIGLYLTLDRAIIAANAVAMATNAIGDHIDRPAFRKLTVYHVLGPI